MRIVPQIVSEDESNNSLGHSVFLRKTILTKHSRNVEIPNLCNLPLREFGRSVLFAAKMAAPSTLHAILDILLCRPSVQMLRIYAGWVVARVQDLKTDRNQPFEQNESSPMGHQVRKRCWRAVPIIFIVALTSWAAPQPTGVCFYDPFHEFFNQIHADNITQGYPA